jgi:hypothetical protein
MVTEFPRTGVRAGSGNARAPMSLRRIIRAAPDGCKAALLKISLKILAIVFFGLPHYACRYSRTTSAQ